MITIALEVYGPYTLQLGGIPVTFNVGSYDHNVGLFDNSSGTLNILLRGSNPVRKSEVDTHEAARIVELVLKRHGSKRKRALPLDDIVKVHREIIDRIYHDISDGKQGTLY